MLSITTQMDQTLDSGKVTEIRRVTECYNLINSVDCSFLGCN